MTFNKATFKLDSSVLPPSGWFDSEFPPKPSTIFDDAHVDLSKQYTELKYFKDKDKPISTFPIAPMVKYLWHSFIIREGEKEWGLWDQGFYATNDSTMQSKVENIKEAMKTLYSGKECDGFLIRVIKFNIHTNECIPWDDIGFYKPHIKKEKVYLNGPKKIKGKEALQAHLSLNKAYKNANN